LDLRVAFQFYRSLSSGLLQGSRRSRQEPPMHTLDRPALGAALRACAVLAIALAPGDGHAAAQKAQPPTQTRTITIPKSTKHGKAAAAQPRAPGLKVEEHFLSNGMKLLLVPRHLSPTVSGGWIAHVGSVNERPGITGISHLFEHMMFKGTHAIG